ncbi:unnamed protein product [Oikopleura dioica]|uniref:Uncharacterized protein n=1 Tax=Oikopleura dioica TaxID=34765 RepID=E4WTP8_OIKDI|nr:unnamed protein product [Oikopleura dioica]
MIYIISITTGPAGIPINRENEEVLQVKLFGENGKITKWTLEAFEIEAPEIGIVNSVKVRLNNQVNYHKNLTNEAITGLFVSTEASSDFYYNSNENNIEEELTSGALYKIGTVFS